MPLYDFECPHKHRFEHFCSIADRNKEIPCEGIVNRLVADEIADEAAKLCKESGKNTVVIDDVQVCFVSIYDDLPVPEPDVMLAVIAVTPVSCMLKAKLVIGAHTHPEALLDHGSASNRDAAREGRYDPLNPNTRFISKGRKWRR